MRVITIVIISWLAFVPSSHSQHSFTYAPDNSALSIILDKVKLDSARTEFKINLKNKWKYRKIKQVSIDIRGTLLTPSPVEQVDSVDVIFKVYGKVMSIKIDSKENYILTFKRTRWQMKCKPKIKISTKALKPGWELYIDSIDMAAVRK